MQIVLHGANGRMGHVAMELLKAGYGGAGLAAAVDVSAPAGCGMYRALREYTGPADCLLDFSHHSATASVYEYVTARHLPCVIATTGQTEQELALLHEAAKVVPVFLSANMSMGIAMLAEFAKQAAAMMPEANIEIVEVHHNRKLDAPSGTALALADSVNEAADNAYTYVYDRSQERKLRDRKEIGISAVRGGTIVGDHDVIFAGADEVLTFSHTAYSRAVFGKGAVQAAKFLAGKPAGLYDMADVIG